MDVDYANDKGSYVTSETAPVIDLTPGKIITWSAFRPEDGRQTFGLLSQVSPDGRYVIGTVKDRSVFLPVPKLEFSQLFFPIQGILAVYDRQTGTFASLPGADDPAFVQSNPSWSPDGQTIVFARSQAYG
jgi:dipeptidyl aminopeptidase/acylaminoacyl peptidase